MFKKILNVLLVIFFPIGAIYCVGKSLFANGISGFIGAILLFVIGATTAIFIFRYDLVEPIVEIVMNFIYSLGIS